MNKSNLGTLLFIGLTSSALAYDHAPTVDQIDTDVSEIEIITITGERHLGFFRQQMQAAEESFFDLYNSLTDKDEYKISCSKKTNTGTNVEHRVCEPQYISDTKYEEMQVALKSGSSHSAGLSPINSGGLTKKIGNRSSNAYYMNLFKQKRKRHLKDVEKQVMDSPELKQRLLELNMARAAFQQKKIEEFGEKIAGDGQLTKVDILDQ